MARYNPKEAEPKWQAVWQAADVFRAPDALEAAGRPKYYALEMFPYPSGTLHVGHVRNYAMGDVIARFKRAQGYNVLHPMGWDAFGLAAENAAIEHGVHPKTWTYDNIAVLRGQLKALGVSIDWSREFATCDPAYYGRQQALFLELYRRGLAYRKEGLVNWDPVDMTVLANEQVVDGLGWRSGAPVEKRRLTQWFLRITDYADELIAGLKTLDRWPDKVRVMQDKWVGRSSGLRRTSRLRRGPCGRGRERLHDPAGHTLWRELRRRGARPSPGPERSPPATPPRQPSSPNAARAAPLRPRSRPEKRMRSTPGSSFCIPTTRPGGCRSGTPTSS